MTIFHLAKRLPSTHVCKVIVMNGGASLSQRLGILIGGAGEEVIAHGTSNLLLVLESWIAFPAGVLKVKFFKNFKLQNRIEVNLSLIQR